MNVLLHNKSVFCYFDANKYSQGSIVSGTRYDVQEGMAPITTPTSSKSAV